MSPQTLSGKRVAFLATDGVERVELERPWAAIKAAGAETTLLSLGGREIQMYDDDVNPAGRMRSEGRVADADPADFDALVLPGGTTNPDKLRLDDDAVAFTRAIFDADKPIAAICHGPWLLATADVVTGRTMTSWPSLQTDLRNAGATWVDQEVVDDGLLITSRNPDDLPAFVARAIQKIASADPAPSAQRS
jgi:protease I